METVGSGVPEAFADRRVRGRSCAPRSLVRSKRRVGGDVRAAIEAGFGSRRIHGSTRSMRHGEPWRARGLLYAPTSPLRPSRSLRASASPVTAASAGIGAGADAVRGCRALPRIASAILQWAHRTPVGPERVARSNRSRSERMGSRGGDRPRYAAWHGFEERLLSRRRTLPGRTAGAFGKPGHAFRSGRLPGWRAQARAR